MNTYFEYVHNLKGSSKFERLGNGVKEAITANYIRELDTLNSLELAIENETDHDVLNFISEHLNLKNNNKNIIFTTPTSSYVNGVDFNNVRAIINLCRVNNIQHPNKLFRAVNTMLPDDGIYIGQVETYQERKRLIYSHVGKLLGRVLWMVDFILHRVIPRIPYLDNLYFLLTNGEFHAISKTEVMGRLIYCGFEIVDFRRINGLTYFAVIKKRSPDNNTHPSYYPLIGLNRVGKNGKMIRVFKFRTMHPYSEYLQDYILKLNGYNNKGKPANDFRITPWGMAMRRLWLDELPQLINVLKGEMKLVGLRPLSQVRFNEFPEDLQIERIKSKPGCFPPYVALNMPDDKKNILAERIYIESRKKFPLTTDIRFFIKSLWNVMTCKISGS
jgi:lipopolysaccharide/colanic/teichoic acid biosynthesis glycosyltransferase